MESNASNFILGVVLGMSMYQKRMYIDQYARGFKNPNIRGFKFFIPAAGQLSSKVAKNKKLFTTNWEQKQVLKSLHSKESATKD